MNIKKHIPNAITCGNLLCGCLGILACFSYRLDLAFYFVILAAILDFFDGFAARILKVSSPIGKDLDSLADMVTFGVLPGFIMYKILWLAIDIENDSAMNGIHFLLPYSAFLITIFSAIRLAKFNNDIRQTDSFIGVPTPANTILISSLGYIIGLKFQSHSSYALQVSPEKEFWFNIVHNQYLFVFITIIMSYLLVAELPLFALKFKNFGWADNKLRYIFLIIAMVLLILFQVIALPFIILLYILLSIINNTITKKKAINP
jgi:CDP-diacylglycerol--serine O-phosphatidyltransferase